MKITEAIESLLKSDEKFLKKTKARVSIHNGKDKIEIPYELLTSDDWGTKHENNDPEFREVCEGLVKTSKEHGPIIQEMNHLEIVKQ